MKTLYEKRGRRYVAVAEYGPEMTDMLPEGAHLIIVQPGSKTTLYKVEPDRTALIAAAQRPLDEVCRLLLDAQASRPSRLPITPEQKAAWDNLQQAFGGGPYYLDYDSVREIARKFLAALTGEEVR